MTSVRLFSEESSPIPFNHLLEKVECDEDNLNELLFCAVLYNIMETGFFPPEIARQHAVTDFNWSALCNTVKLPLEQIYIKTSNNFLLFQSSLQLGAFDDYVLTVRGLPSEEANSHLTVNTLWKTHDPTTNEKISKVASSHFITLKYVELSHSEPSFKNKRDLSIIVKDNLTYEPRSYFSTHYKVLHGHLFSLPYEIKRSILKRVEKAAYLQPARDFLMN